MRPAGKRPAIFVMLKAVHDWALPKVNLSPFLQVLPAMDQVIAEISRMAGEYADVPMLCRTHGQTATPSTMGKEMAVFAYRLQRQRNQVRQS
jgi:adenylosuccinate lyase